MYSLDTKLPLTFRHSVVLCDVSKPEKLVNKKLHLQHRDEYTH